MKLAEMENTNYSLRGVFPEAMNEIFAIGSLTNVILIAFKVFYFLCKNTYHWVNITVFSSLLDILRALTFLIVSMCVVWVMSLSILVK